MAIRSLGFSSQPMSRDQARGAYQNIYGGGSISGGGSSTGGYMNQANQYLEQHRKDVERANREMLQSHQAALGVPDDAWARYQGDPNRQAAMQATFDQLNDPGLGRDTINMMKSENMRRNNVAALGRARGMQSNAAQYGQSGARQKALRSMSGAQNAMAQSMGNSQIEIEAAMRRNQDRNMAINNMAQLAGQANQMNQFVSGSKQNQYNQWQPEVPDIAPWMQMLGQAMGQQQTGASGGGSSYQGQTAQMPGVPGRADISDENKNKKAPTAPTPRVQGQTAPTAPTPSVSYPEYGSGYARAGAGYTAPAIDSGYAQAPADIVNRFKPTMLQQDQMARYYDPTSQYA